MNAGNTTVITGDEIVSSDGTNTTTTNSLGLTATDGTNTSTVTSSDVVISDGTKDINLSDVGYVEDVSSELQNEYASNNNGSTAGMTVVDSINAESAIRSREVNRLDSRVDKLGAMSAAMSSLKSMGYDPQAPTEMSAAIGTYEGQQGFAVGITHYTNRDFMLNLNYANAGGDQMAGLGATWKFGRKTPKELLKKQNMKYQEKVEIANEKAKVAAELAKEAKARAAAAARAAEKAQGEADSAAQAAQKTYGEMQE